MILGLIKFVLIAIVAILGVGLLLWIAGLFVPASRRFRKTVAVYLPVYMTIQKIESQPFPSAFRGERKGNEFIQRLDRKGRTTVTWTMEDDGDAIAWQSESSRAPCGSFRYTVRERGIMSELDYERVLTIRRPMQRLFGLLVSLKKEGNDVLGRMDEKAGQPPKASLAEGG